MQNETKLEGQAWRRAFLAEHFPEMLADLEKGNLPAMSGGLNGIKGMTCPQALTVLEFSITAAKSETWLAKWYGDQNLDPNMGNVAKLTAAWGAINFIKGERSKGAGVPVAALAALDATETRPPASSASPHAFQIPIRGATAVVTFQRLCAEARANANLREPERAARAHYEANRLELLTAAAFPAAGTDQLQLIRDCMAHEADPEACAALAVESRKIRGVSFSNLERGY